MAHGDPRRFGIFVRDLGDFLAPFLVELRDAQLEHLALGRRRQAEIGRRDRLLDGVHHRAIPDLDTEQARLRGTLIEAGSIERHMVAVSLDLNVFEQRG